MKKKILKHPAVLTIYMSVYLALMQQPQAITWEVGENGNTNADSSHLRFDQVIWMCV